MVKRYLTPSLLWFILSACAGASEAPDATKPVGKTIVSTIDGGTVTQSGTWVIPSSVRGTSPEIPLGVPTFSGVMNQDEVLVSSQDLIGHFSVLWFYPFANTSGWTTEGLGFRDQASEYEALETRVYGVSFDAVSNNASFCDNNEFTYDLWSDLERELAQYYGIVDSASALFPSRKTVLLSPEGDWLLIYENPSIPDGLSGHGRVVREDIEAIIAAND